MITHHAIENLDEESPCPHLNTSCLALPRTGYVQNERNRMLRHKELLQPPTHLALRIFFIKAYHEMRTHQF